MAHIFFLLDFKVALGLHLGATVFSFEDKSFHFHQCLQFNSFIFEHLTLILKKEKNKT